MAPPNSSIILYSVMLLKVESYGKMLVVGNASLLDGSYSSLFLQATPGTQQANNFGVNILQPSESTKLSTQHEAETSITILRMKLEEVVNAIVYNLITMLSYISMDACAARLS